MEGRIQVRDLGDVAQLDRVEVGDLMSAVAVAVDQGEYGSLFFRGGGLEPLGGACARARATLLGEPQEVLAHRAVRDLVGRLLVHDMEALAPS